MALEDVEGVQEPIGLQRADHLADCLRATERGLGDRLVGDLRDAGDLAADKPRERAGDAGDRGLGQFRLLWHQTDSPQPSGTVVREEGAAAHGRHPKGPRFDAGGWGTAPEEMAPSPSVAVARTPTATG